MDDGTTDGVSSHPNAPTGKRFPFASVCFRFSSNWSIQPWLSRHWFPNTPINTCPSVPTIGEAEDSLMRYAAAFAIEGSMRFTEATEIRLLVFSLARTFAPPVRATYA